MASTDAIYARMRARQFPLTPNQSDNQQIADLNYGDAQAQRIPGARLVTGQTFDPQPNELFTPMPAPQSASERGPSASAWNTPQNEQAQRDAGMFPGQAGYAQPTDTRPFAVQQRAGYFPATAPLAQPPATRNNFNGAENAPEGSVVRGLDKLLYRRTGGKFLRVPPRTADDFDAPQTPPPPAAPVNQSLALAQDMNADRTAATDAQTAALVARNRTASYANAGLNPDGSRRMQQPDDGTRIGAINNMPTDATAAGRANYDALNESLATSQYDFGLKQDETNDARVRAAASTSGSYLDQNRRSPRYGTRVNYFDPGEVNPAALSRPRQKPVQAF